MDGLPGGCNPADVLFKLAHGRGIKPPIFDQVADHGPPHAKTFTWSCSFFEGQYQSVGHGRSKKEAKNAAAKNLITQLDLSTLPQKPQRHHDNKRKAHAMRQDPAVDGEEAENTGGDQEQLPFPKKRKGNRGNGNYGFMPGNMAQSGFGGFLGDDFMGVGGGLMNVGYFGNYRGRQMWPPRRTMEDRHVLDKHKSIYPDGVELNHILQTVYKVERGLKKISDKFFEDGDGSEREVTGVARVGDLAKSLLLKGDSQVDLVVMCCKKPTASLLENISKSLKTEFQPKTAVKSENCDGEPAKEEPLEIVDNPVESGFVVKSGKCSVRVTLTSTLLRSNNENTNGKEYITKSEDKGVVKTIDEVNTPKIEEDECKDIEKEEESIEKEKEEEPADLLPVEPGLMGLAELRRAKWFSAMAAPLPSCVEALRIMKDKARRDSTWAKLEDWGLELLVERALFSAGYSLSPSKSLMRIVELVASGVLLPEGPGIKDPCEREDIDALDHLTVQDREDVTRQAQTDIRNFHYRKIHQFLDMDLNFDQARDGGKEEGRQ